MSSVKVGTCGYGYYNAPEGWKDEYETKLQAFTHEFSLLEVNKTFYKLPRTSTCEKWRERAKSDFEFTLKGWQALTHTISSPTWRNKNDQLSDRQRDEVGYLRPNETVREAWNRTLDRARALRANVILLQCPGSFEPTAENEENMRALLSSVERGDVGVAWEPRGDWLKEPDRVRSVCGDLNLTHTVDPLRDDPLYTTDTAYLRLHGLNEDPYNYDYDYSTEELEQLIEEIDDVTGGCSTVYCLFNNYGKFDNARKLEELLDC